MTWPTRTVLGINALWLLILVPPSVLGYDIGTLTACAVLGALLPDLDASESKIKHLKIPNTHIKPFFAASALVHRTDRHRGILHSVWGLGFMAIIVAPAVFWMGWVPSVAAFLGYVSHLLGDSATKSGISLLYPSAQRLHLLPPSLRLTTGSAAEEVLFAIGACCALFLLLTFASKGA